MARRLHAEAKDPILSSPEGKRMKFDDELHDLREKLARMKIHLNEATARAIEMESGLHQVTARLRERQPAIGAQAPGRDCG